MKTWISIIVAFFVISVAVAGPGDDAIAIGGNKDKDLFVFKTDKKLVGATVEIYTSEGALVTSQQLNKRKMVIDFGPVSKDTYTIRVVKGHETKEFHYVKK